MGLTDELKKIFYNEENTTNIVFELGSIFTKYDLFALVGRAAVDIQLGNPLEEYKMVELLTPYDKISSSVNELIRNGYKIKSVVNGKSFYEVKLQKENRLPVRIYAYESLPDVLKDSMTKLVSNNVAAYDVIVPSIEDIFLVGLIHDKTYTPLMEKVDKEKAHNKYLKFPEDLKNKMEGKFELD